MNEENRMYVPQREILLYGVANGGQTISYNTLTGYLTYFLVNIFNVDAKIVSSMLFIEGIWDALNDPLMGSVVDRTRTRWGKLVPYLRVVPLPLAVSTALLFSGPLFVGNRAPSDPVKVIYMIVTYFVWEFFYTVGDVPFWGLSTAISPSPLDRTRAITSARFISTFLGGIPGVTIPILLDVVNGGGLGGNLRVFFCMFAIISGTVGMVLFSLAGFFVKERIAQSNEEPSISDSFRAMFTNRVLRLLIFKELLSALGDIGGVFTTYYYLDVLGHASLTLLTGAPGVVVTVVSYTLIRKLKERFNNRQLSIMSMVAPSVMTSLKFLAAIGSGRYMKLAWMIPLSIVESMFNSFFAGVGSVVPTEMIGEAVDYMEWKTGKRTEGVSFSALTFVSKFKGAISRSVGTFLIPVIGYRTSNTGAIVIQTPTTKRNIFAMYTIVPSLLRLLGIIPLLFYDLVGEKRELMYHELTRRRAEVEKEPEEITSPN